MFHFGSGTYAKRDMGEGTQLNASNAVSGKYIQRDPSKDWRSAVPSWMVLKLAGQDASSKIKGFSGCGKDECMTIVTDGHGDGGELWSYYTQLVLSAVLVDHWWDLKRILRKKGDRKKGDRKKGDKTRISKATNKIKSWYRIVEDKVAKLMVDNHPTIHLGGTTASASMVMIVGRKRVVIQSGVGDSPAGIYKKSTGAQQTITEANGDNIRSIREYKDRFEKKGVVPPAINYSRINYSYRSPQIAGHVDPVTGALMPIPAWVLYPEVCPNVDGYTKWVQPAYWYGTQSRNKPPHHQLDNGTWAADPGHEAANFGNTCWQGWGQNLTGVGDFAAGLASDCDASVHIDEDVGDEALVYSWSDGVGDLADKTVLCEKFMEFWCANGDKEFDLSVFRSWAMTETMGEQFYNWSSGCPMHDDCCANGIVLDKYVPPHRRRH